MLPAFCMQHALRCSMRLGAMFQALHKSHGLRPSMSISLWCRLSPGHKLSDLLL
jgi:hypothetical protein